VRSNVLMVVLDSNEKEGLAADAVRLALQAGRKSELPRATPLKVALIAQPHVLPRRLADHLIRFRYHGHPIPITNRPARNRRHPLTRYQDSDQIQRIRRR
jgi:hypothetical protein